MWGALIVAPVIFGLATVFNYSGMANTCPARCALPVVLGARCRAAAIVASAKAAESGP